MDFSKSLRASVKASWHNRREVVRLCLEELWKKKVLTGPTLGLNLVQQFNLAGEIGLIAQEAESADSFFARAGKIIASFQARPAA